MNTTPRFRIVTMVGAAAVVTTITTTPVTARAFDRTQDRPCFMVRSHWNDAEGPEPTCPDGRSRPAPRAERGPPPVHGCNGLHAVRQSPAA